MNSTPLIGAILAQTRAEKGLLLSQVARSINVRPHILEALENNEFDKIGATVYVRGYLKRYAVFLSLDECALDHTLRQVQQNVTHVILPTPGKKRTPYLFYYGIGLSLCFVAAAYYYWANYRETMHTLETESSMTTKANQNPAEILEVSQDTLETQASLVKEATEALAESGDKASHQLADLKSVDQISQQVRTQTQADKIDSIINELGIRNASTDSQNALQTDWVSTSTLTEPVNHLIEASSKREVIVKGSEISLNKSKEGEKNDDRLQIIVNGDNWTEIKDAADRRIFVGVLVKGQTYNASGKAPFKIKFGNVQTVENLRYNNDDIAQDLIKPNAFTKVHKLVVGVPKVGSPEINQ